MTLSISLTLSTKKYRSNLAPIAFNREVTGHIYRPWFEEEKTES